jgi:hypothetical protein
MIWDTLSGMPDDAPNIIQPIEFDRETIGHILADNTRRLRVPKNQRPYKWEKEHIEDLYADLRGAFGTEEYFLGSIVVIKGQDFLEVNDGQQRLATSLILIAAIRDYFFWQKEPSHAKRVQDRYILTENVRTEEVEARLHLSSQDHEFFLNRILRAPDDPLRKAAEAIEPTKKSHMRLVKAAQIAKKFVKDIAGGKTATKEQQVNALWDWLDFLVKAARVIWVEVANGRTAYLIFETMNDRGLKLTSADLLKNRLLAEAGNREEEAFAMWERMSGKMENLKEGEEAIVDYVRYLWIATRGAARSRELYDKIKTSIKSKTDALNFVTELEQRAGDYVALSIPTDDKWIPYGPTARKMIFTLDALGAKQVRTLLLSALPVFSEKQMTDLLRAAICWSVRFLIYGTPSGNLEGYYGKAALAIKENTLRKVSDVTKIMLEWVPTDEDFQSAFQSVAVSQPPLVTYYLRALQLKQDGNAEPEYIPNDGAEINREHIMPESLARPEWAHIQKDMARQFLNRLGNQVLLQQTENSALGDQGYEAKKPILLASAFSLTRDAAKYPEWNFDTIRTRQKDLAELAVKTWPLRH